MLVVDFVFATIVSKKRQVSKLSIPTSWPIWSFFFIFVDRNVFLFNILFCYDVRNLFNNTYSCGIDYCLLVKECFYSLGGGAYFIITDC